ncbi:FMN-dependent NADH-azoreductase [Streptomyces varsoviensis]|uniref:FMN dependent NADH:quinone oxidoreductase n=1 Tax=Streptomyces varsoviensis TaxID=67373 RepID=A0ABR5JCM9_9ACTN|nr:NAD(P)H-dependent oxidoreductase [Streptomyces varsoviensis]KOG91208.1 FMN-dependent NADH-azoreductase [Streptomyces varsoviensis]
MATLLHIDSSLFPDGTSVSRSVTAAFRDAWLAEHPEGTVVHRDLSANPLPHFDAAASSAGSVDPAEHTPEQKAAAALRTELVEELEAADAVVIGAPMYNFTIPSTLKAWLDQVFIIGRTAGSEQSIAGVPVTVVASRGGSYAPGTPREEFEFVQNYLEKIFTSLGVELDFIVPELTLAKANPAMADLIPLAEKSRAEAFEAAAAKGKAIAAAHAESTAATRS